MAVEVGSAYVTIIPSFRNFGNELTRQINGQTKGVGESAGRQVGTNVAKGLSTAGSATADFGKTLTTHVTAPILAIGAASFKTFADFDATMRQVGVQTGQSGAKLQGMSDLALKMGRDTSFSAGQAADAMLELAKGGMTAAQIKGGALAQTLTLAAAGNVSLGDAATYVVNTLNIFGLKAKDSARVAAALAGGANASTASVQSLGLGLAQVGPAAVQAGLSMNETVGALALFDQAGVKGADAGTSLKTMLQRLQPTTKAAAGEMKHLGLDFVDAHGHFLPLDQVAGQLQRKLSGLSDAQRSAALNTIFGSDASRAAAILMQAGAKGVDRMVKSTQDLGAAQSLAKTNTEGAKGSIEQMNGSIETAGITLGRTLAPNVVTVANHVTDLANKFALLPPATQTTVVEVAALAAAAGPAAIALGKITSGLGATVSGVTSMAGVMASGTRSMIAFGAGVVQPQSGLSAFASTSQRVGSALSRGILTGLSGMGRAFGALAGPIRIAIGVVRAFTLALLSNPVFLIIAAIIALGVAVVVLYNKWAPFRNLVNQVGAALVSFGQTVAVGAVAVFHALASAAESAWNMLKSGWDAVGPTVMKLFDALTQPIRGVIQFYTGAFQVLKGIFTGNLDEITTGVANMVGGIVRFFLAMPIRIAAALAPLGAQLLVLAWNALKAMAIGVGNGAVAVFNFFIALPGRVLGFLASLAARLASLGMSALRAMASAIASAAGAVWSFFSSLPGKVVGFLTSLPGRLLSVGTQVIGGLVRGITSAAGAVWSFFTALPGRIISAIGNLGNALYSAGINLIEGLVHGIESAAGNVAKAAVDVVRKAIKAATDALKPGSPSRVFAGLGDMAMAGLEQGFTRNAKRVQGTVTGVMAGMTAAADTSFVLTPPVVPPPRPAVPALNTPGGPALTVGPPDVHVYIGDRELSDMIRVEVGAADENQARQLVYGRR